MLKITVKNNAIYFGEHFSLNFQRTLRIPDDDKTYPLPPGLGAFPVCKVDDYKDRVPDDWKKHGGVFIPMYQREALWFRFSSHHWHPFAVKVAIGKINAVSGEPWEQTLKADKDDYMVCPPQPWLDGINAGDGFIKQFVAMPLGMGYTVEGQITGKEEFGGIQLIVYEPKPGKFIKERLDQNLTRAGDFIKGMLPFSPASSDALEMRLSSFGGAEMGLAAGGKMKQKIYPDPHGIDTWASDNFGRVYVHIVNSMMYREITGNEPPATPITAKTYARYKLPWFDLYDEQKTDITAPDNLQKVKSVKDMDKEKGFDSPQDDSSVDVPDDKIITYKMPPDPDSVRDGDW